MSIRTFNKIMSSKGCIPLMSLVLLLTMVMSFAGRGCSGQSGPNAPQAEGPAIIALVGSFPIDAKGIQDQYEQYAKQVGSPPDARLEATMFGNLLDSQLRAGFVLIEAAHKSVPLTDADIRKNASDQLEQGLMQVRLQLIQQGKLKATATEKEFGDALKGAIGKTLDELKKQQADSMNSLLNDPVKHAVQQARFAEIQVPKVLATRIKPTDAELTSSFRSLVVKQVLLNGPDVSNQIAKVQADLKKGASFETVIDRYSKDKPPVGKKLSAIDAPITSDQLATDAYAPLLKVKAGAVSPVIITPNGSVIYKVLKVKNDVPKDFEKNKETLRADLATRLAGLQFAKDLKELAKTISINWKDPGWHALFDYVQASSDLSLSPDLKQTKLRAVIDEAKTAGHSQPAALAFYVAAADLKAAKHDPAIIDTLIEAIKSVSEFAPGPELSLELADLYAAKKDGAGLGQALALAARENVDPTAKGQATYVNIQAKARKNDALLSADAKTQIADAQAAWQQSSADRKKEEAAAAKAKAESDKQLAADKKAFEARQKAEAAKNKGLVGPPAPKPAPTGKQ